MFFWPYCMACGISVPQPGIKPCPLQWKHRVLTTGPPGKSQGLLFRVRCPGGLPKKEAKKGATVARMLLVEVAANAKALGCLVCTGSSREGRNRARPQDRGHQEAWRQVMWGCGRHYENLALILGEVGAWEGPEQRVDQMSWAPSGCLGAGSISRWGRKPSSSVLAEGSVDGSC